MATIANVANWQILYNSSAVSSQATSGVYTALAGKGYLFCVTFSGANTVTPTLTGGGLTWTVISQVQNDSISTRKAVVFGAVGAGASGALTFSRGAETFTVASAQGFEVTGARVTTTAAMIAQVVTSTVAASTASPSVNITAVGSANAIFGVFGLYGGGYSLTPAGTGYTLLYNGAISAGVGMGVEYRSTTDTNIDGTINSGGTACSIVGLEIAEVGSTPTSVSPSYGLLAGGTAITITGTGFDAAGGTAEGVTIGGVAATSVVFVSATSITCVTPVGTVGAKSVVVTNGDATTGTLANGFTYIVGPVVTPTSGTTNASGVLTTNLTSDQAGVRVLIRAYIGGVEVHRTTTLPATARFAESGASRLAESGARRLA